MISKKPAEAGRWVLREGILVGPRPVLRLPEPVTGDSDWFR